MVLREEIIAYLKEALDAKRLEHTFGVSYTAMTMAMVHDVDIYKAEIAGLLHDCAKNLTYKQQEKLIKKYHITLSEAEVSSRALVHSRLGKAIAQHKFQITDEDILESIANHTTGRANMSQLEKIIYIADYIEPRRKMIPSLAVARKLAYHHLDRCMSYILDTTVEYLRQQNVFIDQRTLDSQVYYKRLEEERWKLD